MPDKDSIRDIALKNAFQHGGKADPGTVLSRFLASYPEERKNAGSLLPLIEEIVREVNSLGEAEITERVSKTHPELVNAEKKVQEHVLPDLKDVKGKVVMRLAPSPSGPLHLGHTRMAFLNDEYVRRYGGKLILRLEDTNPANIEPAAYDMIPEDLEMLGVKVHEIVVQSSRLAIYYGEAESLIKNGHMYACTCRREDAKRLKLEMKACPHRDQPVESNLDLFNSMRDGKLEPGSASLVVRTSLDDPNPSLRDWIAFRIPAARHPIAGDDFHLFPTMNFSVAVDDHFLGLTHVIRGRDQLNNTYRQRFIFDYNGWKVPFYFHYGMISYPGALLKTSLMKKGIREGNYSGWDDVRLLTVRALLKRGYRKETFRKYWIDSGLRDVDATFSWEIFNSINKGFIDSDARRLFFVKDPHKVVINGAPDIDSSIPFHPSRPELGTRRYSVKAGSHVYVTTEDWLSISDGETVRLKDLCNVTKVNGELNYSKVQDLSRKGRIIHWAPEKSIEFTVVKPDGTIDSGLLEPEGREVEGEVQMERYGYVNSFPRKGTGYFTHR